MIRFRVESIIARKLMGTIAPARAADVGYEVVGERLATAASQLIKAK